MRSSGLVFMTALVMFSSSSTCLAQAAAVNTFDIKRNKRNISREIYRCGKVESLALDICQGVGGRYSCGIQADHCNEALCIIEIAEANNCPTVVAHYERMISVLEKSGQCSACA